MSARIREDLLARTCAFARAQGEQPTGGALDELIEMCAAATASSSAEVRRIYDRDLRVWDAV